jgi:hypothetical protein
MTYTIVLFLHVLSAVTWVGGNILFFAVAPRLRTNPEGGAVALRVLGRTFLKLVLVGMALLFKVLHDFWIAPTAARIKGGFFYAALWMGRTNLILGIVILYLSVMIRG